jgi:general L-amino acid transport system substrate-binding protein
VGSLARSCLASLPLAVCAHAARGGSLLDHIRASGRLDCGVVTPLADWDKAALHGDLSVFAAAFCKAVAIAATGKVDALILHRFAPDRARSRGHLRHRRCRVRQGRLQPTHFL